MHTSNINSSLSPLQMTGRAARRSNEHKRRRSAIPIVSLMLALLLFGPFVANSLAQQVPLVYDVENSGAGLPKTALPSIDQLGVTRPYPDPFVFLDGSGRDSSFASWERRRNEIKAAIEKYEIGPKPDTSDLSINAVYTPGSSVLTVTVTRLTNGESLVLNVHISLPSGTPPAAGWPAVIRMALAPGTSPISSSIAAIDYLHDDVTQYAAGQQFSHAADPYFRLYPEYDAGCNSVNYQPYGPCPAAPGRQLVGQYSAWSWGVSRLIDGLEIAVHQAVNPLPIDLRHLGVNGCSYAGKMALFAGAFDERIAATFAQESGGGGAPAWRTSEGIEPDGTVEKTSNTDGSWFINTMKSSFGHDKTYKLPEDHHLLMAMVAPRALMVSGNTDFVWLSNRSTYVSAKATQRIYETLGIGDRFGFWIDGNHGHCALGANEQPQINAFYNKFLGGQDVAWDVHVFPQTPAFTNLDYQRWTAWWGNGDARFPDDPITSLSSTTVAEKQPTGTVVGTFSIINPDGSPASGFAYSLVNGTGSADNAAFTIDGDTLRTARVFDYATKDRYSIRVRTANGPSLAQAIEKTFTIAVMPPDLTPPASLATTNPGPNSNGWNNGDVVVAFLSQDDASGSGVKQINVSLSGAQTGTITTSGESGQITISAEGLTTVSYYATDNAGNDESTKTLQIKIDKTPPTINVNTPADGSVFLQNSSVSSNYGCTDNVSTAVTCSGTMPSGSSLNTSTVGAGQFTVTSSDSAGNTSSKTVSYSVQYLFVGFSNLQPAPVQNTAKAGRTVVVRYQLKDANGNYVFDPSSFVSLLSSPVACSSGVGSEAEQVTTPVSTTVTYDAGSNQFVIYWKTDKAWANSCRVLRLTLADGTTHDVLMKFR